jgi:hypothetical protein
MNEAKVTKGDVVALAQAMGQDVNDANRRIHALNLVVDCLMTVLTRHLAQGDFAGLVKSEMERRVSEAKAKAEEKPVEQTPLISVP